MHNYKYTDRFLIALALGNVLIIPLAIWIMWWPLSLSLAAHEGSVTAWTTGLLTQLGVWLTILIFCTWAILKRWRFVLFFYVPYLARDFFISTYVLISYWQNNDTGFGFLDSKIYSWAQIILFLLALLSLISMFIETDYQGLNQKWQLVLKKFHLAKEKATDHK